MTAGLLLPAGADHDVWLAQRRKSIGASEIAAVMGISPFESPFSLYWRKVNGWNVEMAADMEWGLRLEDAVAAKFADEHPDVYLGAGGLYRGQRPWQTATPDRLVFGGDDPAAVGVLELKTAHNTDGWGEAGTDEIPVHYRAQVLWQIDVLRLLVGHVAVLIGGSDYREYTVLRDEADIAVMREHGRRFMARIAAGDPPDVDSHSATMATLKRLHPDLDDTEAEIPADIAAGYRRSCEMARKAKDVKARYEARLRLAMGRSRKATSDGAFVASRSIYDVAEHSVSGHTVDRLNPPRSKK